MEANRVSGQHTEELMMQLSIPTLAPYQALRSDSNRSCTDVTLNSTIVYLLTKPHQLLPVQVDGRSRAAVVWGAAAVGWVPVPSSPSSVKVEGRGASTSGAFMLKGAAQ